MYICIWLQKTEPRVAHSGKQTHYIVPTSKILWSVWYYKILLHQNHDKQVRVTNLRTNLTGCMPTMTCYITSSCFLAYSLDFGFIYNMTSIVTYVLMIKCTYRAML